MYSVSALWNDIITRPNHEFETQVIIDGTTYGKDVLREVVIERRAFSGNEPSVGGCISAEISLSMENPDITIPRMATIIPQVRVVEGTDVSEWIPQGRFYIDTRQTSKNSDNLEVLSLHGYDDMLKSEADYATTVQEQDWPCFDVDVVREIAYMLGLQNSVDSDDGIDPRTFEVMTGGYRIGLPVGYSMREVLGNIAAMYAGNWVMNYDGQLLLVALGGIPPETSYLIDYNSNPITFGEAEEVTESGENVGFLGTISSLSADIQLVQPGSGNPTPTNVRPITGFSGINLHVDSSTYSVSWQTQAGTIYGGNIDLLAGELTVTWVGFDGGSVNWTKMTEGKYGSFYYVPPYTPEQTHSKVCVRSSCYTGKTYSEAGDDGQSNYFVFISTTGGGRIQVKDSDKSAYTGAQIKEALTGQTFAYSLSTPRTYQLTPVEISEEEGNVWADTGNVTITYESEPVLILV